MTTTTSTSNGLVGREAFLAKNKRRHVTIDLPTGGRMRLQSLTEKERSAYESALLNKKGDGADRSKLLEAKRHMVILCAVDEQGNRLFSMSDMHALAEVDSADIDHACSEARKHCRFDDQDFEELVGNSEPVPAADSPSA